MKWGLIWMILALASMIAPTKAAAEETVVPVAASALIDDDVSGAEKVSDEDLSKERGKFVWAGVEVSLGAEMRTYVNGALVLQTNVSWNAQGAQTTQFVSGALTPVDASRLQSGILTGAGITMHIGDQSVFLANQGQTLLMQRSENGLQNVLINRASNVQISQQVDATIGLANFTQFQNSLMNERVGSALSQMVSQAVVGRAP